MTKRELAESGQIGVEDFDYFIGNDMFVVGVFEEEDDMVNFVILKADSFPVGQVGGIPKNILDAELETGVSVRIDDPEAAMVYEHESK